MSAATHGYLGIAPCGHVVRLIIDDATPALAISIGDVINRGGTVERMPLEDARQRLIGEMCTCSKDDRWRKRG